MSALHANAVQEAQTEPSSSQAPQKSPLPAKNVPKQKSKTNGKRPQALTKGRRVQGRRPKQSESDKGDSEDDVARSENSNHHRLSSPLSEDIHSINSPRAAVSNPETSQDGVAATGPAEKSDSEMSAVLDEDPRPKKKARKSKPENSGSGRQAASKITKAPQPLVDPESEEIKRLQSWLVKCGIRKMWHKELASYGTAPAKIRHLKEMLTDAGMTGRYSNEKAIQIREARELKADLEAVQAGNKQWGKSESEEDGGGKPKRRLARGLKELDFLNDDDGEETD